MAAIQHGGTDIDQPAPVEQVSTDVDTGAYTPIAHGDTGSDVTEPTPVEQVSTDEVNVYPSSTDDDDATTTYNNGLWTPSSESPTSTESDESSTTSRTRRSTRTTESSTSDSSSTTSSESSSSSSSSPLSSSSPSSSSSSSKSHSHSSGTTSERALHTSGSSSAEADHDGDSDGIGIVKPLVIAGAVLLVLLLAGLYWTWRRRRNRRRQDEAFGIPVGASSGGGWAGFLRRKRSEEDLAFDEPTEDPGMQEKGYGAVSRWDGQYDDRYDDANSSQWDAPTGSHRDYGNMAGVGVASAAAAAASYDHPSQYHQEAPLQSANGSKVRRKVPVATQSQDLDDYLAEGRTGYTPEEAQQEFPQQGPGFVGGMFRTLSNASGQRKYDGVHSAMPGEPATPPRQRAYGFNDVDPTHIPYPALATPQSVQRNNVQTTRDVHREGADLLTGSPTKASSSRAPPSLRPRSDSNYGSPLSPPLQPHLFYSTSSSPGVAMPPASNAPSASLSINGLASYLYPSTTDMQQDNFTAVPTSRHSRGSPSKAAAASNTPTQRKRDARNQEAFRQVEDIISAGSPAREDGRLLHHEDDVSDDESLHDLLNQISDGKRGGRF